MKHSTTNQNASKKATPLFTKDDLEYPSSEGRSLHDLMNKFLHEEMSIETPVVKLSQLVQVLDAMEATTNKEFQDMIFDLKATERKAIIPDRIDCVDSLVGIIWAAAGSINTPHSPCAPPRTLTDMIKTIFQILPKVQQYTATLQMRGRERN